MNTTNAAGSKLTGPLVALVVTSVGHSNGIGTLASIFRAVATGVIAAVLVHLGGLAVVATRRSPRGLDGTRARGTRTNGTRGHDDGAREAVGRAA